MSELAVASSLPGMILGTAGLVISIMNYLRDRPDVRITLNWHMQDTRTGKATGLVRVTNAVGKAVFISIFAIELPKGLHSTYLVLSKSLDGMKSSEGDRPLAIFVPYGDLAKYPPVWRQIRAYAEDSTGKRYRSKYPRKNESAPPWVR
jgi:hypothetical protein